MKWSRHGFVNTFITVMMLLFLGALTVLLLVACYVLYLEMKAPSS